MCGQNSAFWVRARMSRADVPPGGMHSGEYRFSLEKQVLSWCYLSGISLYLSTPGGYRQPKRTYTYSYGTGGMRGWDSCQKVCVTWICLLHARTGESNTHGEMFCTVLVLLSLNS